MKVLLIRFSSIGDMVLTSPVIRCLYEQKDAEIDVLTKTAFAAIPAANPMVHRVYAFGKTYAEDKIIAHENLSAIIAFLKVNRYDYVIDLHHNLRSLRVKWALGRPSFSFDKLNLKKWLLVNFKCNILPDQHIVHRYMNTVSAVGVQYDGKGLDFHIPPNARSTAITKVSAVLGPVENQPYIAFVIGATHATKRLPVAKMIEVCRRSTLPILLIGGPDEAKMGAEIVQYAGGHVRNGCGQFSLFESAFVVQNATQVITHDTGMMHIAAAFRKRVIAVWGNTVPEFGMYPFYPDGLFLSDNIEVKGLACRPCSKIGSNHCPRGHFRCMNDQKVERILSKISP